MLKLYKIKFLIKVMCFIHYHMAVDKNRNPLIELKKLFGFICILLKYVTKKLKILTKITFSVLK